jgi:hypothetical protein
MSGRYQDIVTLVSMLENFHSRCQSGTRALVDGRRQLISITWGVSKFVLLVRLHVSATKTSVCWYPGWSF